MSLKSLISSHVRISYRFYQFVTTRYATDFYIIKTIRFGFCDTRNNRGFGKRNHPQPSASADDSYLDLDNSHCHKSSSSNCL